MSLQWTLIASFLYAEIAVVLLLVLPIASPQRWQRFFKSRFLQSLGQQASLYFLVLLAILVLFLLDAIREMRKYSSPEISEHKHGHLDAEMQGNMRLFRAQRNFYISGFSLFLSLVIRRLVSLISAQASLLAQSEAAMKQAKSATSAARSYLQNAGESAQNDSNEAHDKVVNELKGQLKEAEARKLELEAELAKERKDKAAVKAQAESLTKEYDRLSQEHAKAIKTASVAAGGDKKSD